MKKLLILCGCFINTGITQKTNTHNLEDAVQRSESLSPNIIFVLGDDIGVNDVSWNRVGAATPRLEKLALDGIILDNAYTLPVCTPSRTALMTGTYPYKLGMQRGYSKLVPDGVPVNNTMLPEYLKQSGYKTLGLGKWHLGYCSDRYTPTGRGFDKFEGLYTGDDGSAEKIEERKLRKMLKRTRKGNRKSDKQPRSKFSSLSYADTAIQFIKENKETPFFIYLSLLTKSYPNQRARSHIDLVVRARKEKIRDMDQAVHKVVKALKEEGVYDNTVLIFMSDNGARYLMDPINYQENNPNFPLKGHKDTIYEGGTKVPGFIHSPLLKQNNYRYKGLLHMVDFLPTLLSLVANPPDLQASVDGLNQWEAITTNGLSPRKDMVYNIDDNFVPPILNIGDQQTKMFQVGVRDSTFKLIWGQAGMLHRSNRQGKGKYKGSGLEVYGQTEQLYNLEDDPGETRDISSNNKDIVDRLKDMAIQFYKDSVPSRFLGLQTMHKVSDYMSPHGAKTGWCQAVISTKCSPTLNSTSSRLSSRTAVELYYGTLTKQPLYCVSDIAK